MFKKLKAAPVAALAILATTLMHAGPALASTSPGTGTLGAIFGWLLSLFS